MHSESTVPVIPGRGYQMMQKPQSGTVNGLSIDVDTTMVDELGGACRSGGSRLALESATEFADAFSKHTARNRP